MQTQPNPNEYEQAWQEGPDAAPAPTEGDAIRAKAKEAAELQAREFAEAFHAETPASPTNPNDGGDVAAKPEGEQVAGIGSWLRGKAGMQTDEDRKTNPMPGGDDNTKLRGKQLDEKLKTAGA